MDPEGFIPDEELPEGFVPDSNVETLPPGQRPFPENPDLNAPGSSFEPTAYIPPGESPPPLFKSFLPMPEHIKGKTLLGKTGAAMANVGLDLAGGATSLGGLATLPLGLLGKAGAVAGGLGFGVPQTVEGLKRVYRGTALGDYQEALEGALQTGTGGLITMGGVKAGLEPRLKGPAVTPEATPEGFLPDEPTKVAETTPSSPEPIPNAIKDQSLSEPPEEWKHDYHALAPIRTEAERVAKTGTPRFETITPRQDIPLGVNDAGERLYKRRDNGEVYRMRFDRPNTRPNGYPDFGGDLSQVEQAPPSVSAGEAQPSAAPGGATVEAPVTAGATPQAKAEVGTPETVPQAPNVTTPVTEPPKGIAASVRTKWVTATAEPFGSESGFVNLDPIKELVEKATPYVRGAVNFVKDIGREEGALTKLGDYGKSVLLWSGKLQKSFSEAAEAQKEIETKVPDPVKRAGITNWIQANGDPKVLTERALSTNDPKLKAGYDAALKLTPEEVAVAKDVKGAFDSLGLRGDVYDVLNNFKENYVTQIWDLGKGPVVGGARNLRNKFRFSKASTFPTYFDGEQAGYVPRTKDISKILPVYLHEMNFVIANRQLAEHLTESTASDGRPLAEKIESGKEPANEDYKSIPGQPAISGWRFHPEAFSRLKNILGKSAIREWYSNRTSALAEIPKKIVQGLDNWNSETKRTMLGLLAPFHQVQEGTHAVGHRVNPFFNIPKIDLIRDRAQADATNHGLMLAPDRVSAEQFMEGFRTSGLVSKIPGIGKLADHYSNYLFHEYIPGLKYKTYQAILDRNTKLYSTELSSGEVSVADVKHLSAEQANAAYGHLNYVDLARNPTIQHIMQLGVLAPDFLESRARFTGQSIKGLTGAKVGREQLLALATLAVGQAAAAYTSAKLSGGEWDPKRPFEFHVGNRRYTMRSVPEDISSLLHDSRAFAYSRISPIIGKGTAQYLSGTDYRGQKISAGETTKELAQQMIPISIRGFTGMGRQSLSGWEQLASAVGLRISRYSPSNDVFDMAHKWMAQADPKTQKRLQMEQASVFPESEYKTIRNALVDNNLKSAKQAYGELLKTKSADQIYRALSHPHPFTGSASTEAQFVKSLTPSQKKLYDQAQNERNMVVERFSKMKSNQ